MTWLLTSIIKFIMVEESGCTKIDRVWRKHVPLPEEDHWRIDRWIGESARPSPRPSIDESIASRFQYLSNNVCNEENKTIRKPLKMAHYKAEWIQCAVNKLDTPSCISRKQFCPHNCCGNCVNAKTIGIESYWFFQAWYMLLYMHFYCHTYQWSTLEHSLSVGTLLWVNQLQDKRLISRGPLQISD